jgi:hypothetical protein
MAKPLPSPPPPVYQLRVVLRGISPLIWRRLLVRSDTTFARLHDVLQVAFGWDDVHLHCFKVHGRELDAIDGPYVRLADFGLRPTERFVYDYDYDYGDLWRHDVRVEQILDVEPGRTYPVCTGGRRAGPPEDCGGAWAFLEQAQAHRIFAAMRRTAEIVTEILDGVTELGEHREELALLRPWLMTEHFDRRALNRALAQLSVPEERAA